MQPDFVLAVALVMSPLGAWAADLVVWWNEGYYAEEDEAVREIVAAFEQKAGKQVDLVLHPEQELPEMIVAVVEAGRPPDFAFSVVNTQHDEQWAYEGRLVDLTDAVGHFADLFDLDALKAVTLLDATTGRRGLYLLPVGFSTHHVHAWKSLLEQAGFTLEDIPKEWEAFWTFWCDEVQPAARRALGRDDIWGTGLTMSVNSNDTLNGFWQFVDAYEADYVGTGSFLPELWSERTRDGRLVIDDPEVRRRLIQALDGYTAIYRKGCAPPDSITWTNRDNNEAFLEQSIVMTVNQTLSIPNKATRPEDYYDNAVTIDWPAGAYGQPLPIETFVNRAAVFKDGGNVVNAKEFVRFLVGEGWLAPLPRLCRRAHAANDAKAASGAVLAGPGQLASHALGHAAADPPACPRMVHRFRSAGSAGRRGGSLAEGRPSRRDREHQRRAGGRRGDRPASSRS